MIKISVRDIFTKGLDIDQTIPKEGIGLSDEEIDLRSPLNVKAHLERVGDIITADAHVKVDVGFLCARCLKDLHHEETFDYHFDFELGPGVEYVDLGEEIRQEMILANPPRVVCSEDCKGMCSKCGVDLNVEKCKCK